MLSELEGAESETPQPVVERLNEVEAAQLPEFQRPDGRLDKGRYLAYLAVKDREEAEARPPRTGPSEYEVLMVRLVAKVCDIAEEVYATNRRMWPATGPVDTPGTPWRQPFWLRPLIDAYLSGKAEAQDNR